MHVVRVDRPPVHPDRPLGEDPPTADAGRTGRAVEVQVVVRHARVLELQRFGRAVIDAAARRLQVRIAARDRQPAEHLRPAIYQQHPVTAVRRNDRGGQAMARDRQRVVDHQHRAELVGGGGDVDGVAAAGRVDRLAKRAVPRSGVAGPVVVVDVGVDVEGRGPVRRRCERQRDEQCERREGQADPHWRTLSAETRLRAPQPPSESPGPGRGP